MLRHSEAVLRATPTGFVVIADMPYGTYDTPEKALQSALQFRNIGINILKLEGGEEIFPQIEILIKNKFKITGHIGLLPQTAKKFTLVGRDEKEKDKLQTDAIGLQKRGVQNIVLECIPATTAKKLQNSLDISCIGIGAGADIDGQILVYSDLVGRTNPKFSPKFLKRFGETYTAELTAIQKFTSSVRKGEFPSVNQSY